MSGQCSDCRYGETMMIINRDRVRVMCVAGRTKENPTRAVMIIGEQKNCNRWENRT
jgi:hypothetical protein